MADKKYLTNRFYVFSPPVKTVFKRSLLLKKIFEKAADASKVGQIYPIFEVGMSVFASQGLNGCKNKFATNLVVYSHSSA